MAMAQTASVGTVVSDRISIVDAARILNIHHQSLRRLILQKIIPAMKVRGMWVLQLVHVEMFKTNYNPRPGVKPQVMLL